MNGMQTENVTSERWSGYPDIEFLWKKKRSETSALKANRLYYVVFIIKNIYSNVNN
jgi:hypothetical protein